jgi:hypothetical protein
VRLVSLLTVNVKLHRLDPHADNPRGSTPKIEVLNQFIIGRPNYAALRERGYFTGGG